MQKINLLLVALLFSINSFSQTKLNLDINDLKDPDIECYLEVLLVQERMSAVYQYHIYNDTINGIVYLTDKKWERLPIDGDIVSKNVKIDYGITINGVVNEGVLREKLVMDRENYFIFRIKENEIIIEK